MADSGRFSQFTGEDGIVIEIDRVLTVIVALLSTQWFGSIAQLFTTVFDTWLISPLSGLVEFSSALVTKLFAGQVGNVDRAVADFISWMGALPDILGFVIAVAAVLGLAYLVVLAGDASG
ncbi:hypothetical protein [Halobaculum sp. EA56]|uniref:hypothetical protein n=1 Tax=Halobaculum sp. EA56 TaxID=3421648 RepID=UPI003EB9AC21